MPRLLLACRRRQTPVYIGLQNGSLLVSNGGASPASIYAFSGLGSLTPQVHDIVVDPTTPTAVYVSLQGFVNGIFSDGLYASVDGGRTFNLVTLPVDIRGAQAIAMSPSTPHLLYVLGTRLYTTVDGGATFSPYGYYGDGRSITPIAGTPDALYVAGDQGLYAQKGGAYGSIGATNTALSSGFKNFIVQSLAMSGSQIMATMQDYSTAVSTNGGNTWTFPAVLQQNDSENGQVFINPLSPNFCYDVNAALSISSDGCATFNTVQVGSKVQSTSEFAASPNAPTIYVVTNNGILVANDGKTFTPVTWPVPNPVDIAIDPSNAKNIFVSSALASSPAPGSIYVSHDGGATWSQSGISGTSGQSFPGEPADVAVDPANSNVVLAATDSQVYRSLNGGASFTAIGTNYIGASDRTRFIATRDYQRSLLDANSLGANQGSHLAFNSTGKVPLVVYANLSGMYISSDLGSHFHSITANAVSHSFWQPQWLNGKLCIATHGEGVICTTSSIQP